MTRRLKNLRSLATTERPREKLIDKGPAALSDRELLAILLQGGNKGRNVNTLAQEILDQLDRKSGIPTVRELARSTGIGEDKACSIVAMLEVGRRRWGIKPGTQITQPDDIYPFIRHHADRRQELFICVSLNGAHEVMAVRVVTIGLVNKTMVHPREVFADPILDRASAVIVAHNHPSGNLLPSDEDDEVTERLRAAADILGLDFMDHLIFSERSFFSYRKAERFSEAL